MKKCALFNARWWLRVSIVLVVFAFVSIVYKVDFLVFTNNALEKDGTTDRDVLPTEEIAADRPPVEHVHTHQHQHLAAIDSNGRTANGWTSEMNPDTDHTVEHEQAISVAVTTGTIDPYMMDTDEDEEAEEKTQMYGEWPSASTNQNTENDDTRTNQNSGIADDEDISRTIHENADGRSDSDRAMDSVDEKVEGDAEEHEADAEEDDEEAFKPRQHSGEMAQGVVVGMPEDEAAAEAKEMNGMRKANSHQKGKMTKVKHNPRKGACEGSVTGENELAITTYVSGLQYQNYIPLYIYFALLAYPDAYVAVYLQEALHPDLALKLDVIPSDRWCVHQNYKTKLSQSGHSSLMRNFLNADFLQQFKYQYVGDVDIFILRETPSLVEQHVQHMQTIGEPYSNVDRFALGMPDKIDKGHKCKSADCHRVTGLHFFETKPYMAKIKSAQDKWEKKLTTMGGAAMCEKELSVRKLAWCDETLLYRIITDSGMSVPKREHWFRPHHGVHIRIYNKHRKAVKEYAQQLLAILHNHLEALVPYIYEPGMQSELAFCISMFLQKESWELYSEYRVYAKRRYKISIEPISRQRKRGGGSTGHEKDFPSQKNKKPNPAQSSSEDDAAS